MMRAPQPGRPGRRRAAVGSLSLAAALLVASCGSADPAPPTPTPTPTPTPLTAELRLPDAPTTVLPGTGADLAVATSAALFASSPVVVLAPDEDVEAQLVAAPAAVGLGAPLLLVTAKGQHETSGPQDAGLLEAQRLGAEVAVVVGTAALVDEVRAAAPGLTVLSGPVGTVLAQAGATPGEALDVPATEEVTAVAALDPARPALLAGEGMPRPETVVTDPGVTPELPLLARPRPTAAAALVTDGDPTTLAAVATARAAGLGVAVAPGGDPRTTSGAVQAVAAAAGPTDTLLAAGPSFAAFADVQDVDWRLRTAATGVELPGGGQVVFPGRRLVALYGSPGFPELGVLGEQAPAAAAARAQELATTYQGLTTDTVVPAFEIIATIADREAGPDGNYSNELPVDTLRPWVDAATAAGQYVILDLQPGRTDFLTQAQLYAELLARPNVGLALDPEWRLAPGQVHLRQIGSVDAAEVNAVAAWLATLTREQHLPQKVLVLHQFAERMIRDRATLDLSHPELATVLHVDGQGSQPAKAGTWAALRRDAPAGLWWGWKNFVDEDVPMLTPEQTYQVAPVPDLVTYQ